MLRGGKQLFKVCQPPRGKRSRGSGETRVAPNDSPRKNKKFDVSHIKIERKGREKWSATPIFGGSWRALGEEVEDTNITEESELRPLQDSTMPGRTSDQDNRRRIITQSPPEAPNRLQKAKNTLQSGKKFLGEAKNLKTSIKTGTTTALEGLFQSVKEAENERRRMEEVVKEKEERLAQYERIGIRKEGEESEKERKEKHEEKEEIVKELKNRMEEWREKYMEKERKLREIEKEIEEFGMTCVECENKAVQMTRMSSDNYELRELQYAEVDEKIRQLMDARSEDISSTEIDPGYRGENHLNENRKQNEEIAKTCKQLFPGPYPGNYGSTPPVYAHR
ncbi:hypothetical protein ACJJTC_003964 [Scirpophaga incertulas]